MSEDKYKAQASRKLPPLDLRMDTRQVANRPWDILLINSRHHNTKVHFQDPVDLLEATLATQAPLALTLDIQPRIPVTNKGHLRNTVDFPRTPALVDLPMVVKPLWEVQVEAYLNHPRLHHLALKGKILLLSAV